jgi:hypothetical protein
LVLGLAAALTITKLTRRAGPGMMGSGVGVRDEVTAKEQGYMADPQDRPNDVPDAAPQDTSGAGSALPADKASERSPGQSPPPATAPQRAAKRAPAKKAPAKAAKKAHQTPAKAAKKSQQPAAKKPTVKKGPAGDPPPKKAPVKKAESAAKPNTPPFTQPRIDSDRGLAAAAKDAAAQAKSTVDSANNPVSESTTVLSAARPLVPLMVAIAVSLLALVLLRQLRRRDS